MLGYNSSFKNIKIIGLNLPTKSKPYILIVDLFSTLKITLAVIQVA